MGSILVGDWENYYLTISIYCSGVYHDVQEK